MLLTLAPSRIRAACVMLVLTMCAAGPGRAQTPAPLLTDIGRVIELQPIQAIFDGTWSGGDNPTFRIIFQRYVYASNEHCGKNTPNGTTLVTKTTTPRLETLAGEVLEEGKPYVSAVYDVDIALSDKFIEYLESFWPGLTPLNIVGYGPVLELAQQDLARLFGTWQCGGREIRQFQENLRRVAYGLPSLQAVRDRALPIPVPVQQACEAYVASPEPDPSGYRLSSCACFASNLGDPLTEQEANVLRRRFDATQMALLSASHDQPALLDTCIVPDTRVAPPPPVSSDEGLLLRHWSELGRYELREPEDGAWCGPTARVDLFYGAEDDYTAEMISTQLDGLVVNRFIPWLETQCRPANRLSISVYHYGTAELLKTNSYRWAASGGVLLPDDPVVPTSLVERRQIIYPPVQTRQAPSPGGAARDRAPRRMPAVLGDLVREGQRCTNAQEAVFDRYFSGDACAVPESQLLRARDDLARVFEECGVQAEVEVASMRLVADRRCRLQREGTATRREAELLQRLEERNGCDPLTDPRVARRVDEIQQSTTSAAAQEQLDRFLGPVADVSRDSFTNGLECAGRYLLATSAAARTNDAAASTPARTVVAAPAPAPAAGGAGSAAVIEPPGLGPFTAAETETMARVWQTIRGAARYEDINWATLGLRGPPGSPEAQRLMSAYWEELRGAAKFTDINWQATAGYSGGGQ